jgi:hypothetical protein
MSDRDDKPRGAKSRQFNAEIDRIEDDKMAVLLVGDKGKTQLDVPVELLPEGASDGDHLRVTISIDRDARASAAERVKRLQDKLAKASGTDEQKDFKL